MRPLPPYLYLPAQLQQMDRYLIDIVGVAGLELMERAGAAVLAQIAQRWPAAHRLTILCGGGNNGGDGYIVAALALAAGLEPTVLFVKDPQLLRGDAHLAWQRARAAGVDIRPYDGGGLNDADLIVDALLGTGLQGGVSDPSMVAAIAAINATPVPVVAIDIPSGVDGACGWVAGVAVVATLTVTLMALKQGLFMADGCHHCGEVVLDDLQAPAELLNRFAAVAQRLTLSGCGQPLGPRHRNSHKGDFGHLLLVGGNRTMGGAIRIATEGAARTGCGLLTVATHADSVAALLSGRPEAMVHAVAAGDSNCICTLLQQATAVVLGPGLGQDGWARSLVKQLFETTRPMVVDADALNLLVGRELRREQWVLTPHPGEAARLLQSTILEVQSDRVAAATTLAERYGACVVLKGAGSVVVSPGKRPMISTHGNPGMASGGMGDLLSGVIGGLLAQGVEPYRAACYGVALHAAAGDGVAQQGGEIGMLATDLLPEIRRLINTTYPEALACHTH